MKRLFLLLSFLLFICSIANAQTIPYRQYGVEDGLGNSIVYDVFQDSKGYMWFSTDHGLSKFDGLHFTNYTMADGLPTNYIMSAAETKDGTIWLLTFGYGTYQYKNGKFSFFDPGKSDAPDRPFHIIADKKNRLWIFFNGFNKEVWYIENGYYQRFSINKYLHDTLSRIVYTVFIKHDGTAILATSKGCFMYKGDSLMPIADKDIPVYAIDEDKAGNLWLGSDSRILELSTDKRIHSIAGEFLKGKQVKELKSDNEGKLWISTAAGAFYAVNTTNGEPISKLDMTATAFYEDAENNFWVCTFGNGVLCFAYPNIVNYTVKDGLAGNIIKSVMEDAAGKTWIATLNGISYFDKDDSKQSHLLPYPANTDEIFGCTSYKDELIYSPGVAKLVVVKNGISKKTNVKGRIRSFSADKDGRVWIAMDSGICYYQHDSVLSDKKLSIVDSKKVYGSIIDSKGHLWMATNDGVYSYDGKTVQHYSTRDGLANNMVNSVWQDSQRKIWFATGEGISIMDDGKWVKDTLLACLRDIMCNCFAEDSNHNIWIGTNNGLFVYDGKRIRQYDIHTGLPDVEIQSLYIDSKDHLWVGTLKGLSRIDLNTYADMMDSYPPKIYILNVKVNGNTISGSDSLPAVLRYSDNNLSINYTGLYFKNPGSLIYEYKLSGASDRWSKTVNGTVDFSALAPGRYQFSVRAQSGAGVYSVTPAVFAFTILPPFWKSTWFILLEMVLGLIVISILFRWRLYIHKQKALEKSEKQRIALEKKLTEEELQNAKKMLGSYMVSMAEKNELIEKFSEEIKKLEGIKSKEIEEVRIEQLEDLNRTTILTEDDWIRFRELFEQVYKGYLIRLKEKMPDLTQAEIRFMCLSKLKVDANEMKDILGVSFNTVKSLRHRLRKKLNLSEEDSLYNIAETI